MARKAAAGSRSARSAKAAASEAKADGVADLPRLDGFSNTLTGVGTAAYDHRQATTFAAGAKLTSAQCADLYRFGGLARRLIDLPINDACRNWFRVKGDDDNVALSRLEELGAQPKISQAGKLARAFGGALVLMGINDGQALDKPVRVEAVKSVDCLLVYDPREATPTGALDEDFTSTNFGEPLLYQVRPIGTGPMQIIHHSRLLRFDGAQLPRDERLANNWWHDSVYNACWEKLRQVGSVFDSAEFVVEDFVQHIITLEGVLQAAASRDGQGKLKTRLQMLEQSRSTLGTMLLDAKEKYEKATTQAAGLGDLLDRFMMALSAVVGIPVALLFGRSPAGLNATGESDTRHYYDSCAAMQRNEIGPQLERLVRLILIADGWSEEEDWSIAWAPIYTPTAQETGEIYKLTAEGDAAYIGAQVADPAKVEEYRMGGVRFNPDPPTWEIEERPEIDPAEVEAMRQQQEAAKLAAQGGAAVPPQPPQKAAQE